MSFEQKRVCEKKYKIFKSFHKGVLLEIKKKQQKKCTMSVSCMSRNNLIGPKNLMPSP